MGGFMEGVVLDVLGEFAPLSVFPKLKFEFIYDKSNEEDSKEFDSILKGYQNYLKSKNDKEYKIPSFLYTHINNYSCEDADFQKLIPNIKAMELLFKEYSFFGKYGCNKLNDQKYDIGFPYEFLETKPDSELQSIFFLILIYESLFLFITNTNDKINKIQKFKDFIRCNLVKLDKQSQIDVMLQILRNFSFYENLNCLDLYDIIFEEINEKLDDGKFKNINQIIRYKNYRDFLSLDKETQIYLINEFTLTSFQIFRSLQNSLEKFDLEVLAKFFESIINSDIIKIINEKIERESPNGFLKFFKIEVMKDLNIYLPKHKLK